MSENELADRLRRISRRADVSYSASAAILDVANQIEAASALRTQAAPPHDPSRWNVETTATGIRACFGGHERAAGCEWVEYVPQVAPPEEVRERIMEAVDDALDYLERYNGHGRRAEARKMIVAALPTPAPLNALATEIRAVNRANGWNICTVEDWPRENEQDVLRRYHIPAILALIHSEVSEALEAFRKGDRENFAEELADVLIRVLDVAGGMEIDMEATVSAKLERNRQRGYRHGGKAI